MFETFAYDAWNNTTSRVSESWLNDFYDSASYTNGRRTDWGYDADGRIASIDTRAYSYDAAGQNRLLSGQRWTPSGYVPTTTTSDFDGEGNRIREISNSNGLQTTTYYLWSSVLGSIVEELSSGGIKQLGYVSTAAGGLLATQVPGANYVMLKQLSPTGASQHEFFASNTATGLDIRREFDPAGATVPLQSHNFHSGGPGDISIDMGGPADSRFSAIENPAAGCAMDGVYMPCSMAYRVLGAGAARVCPNNDCSPRRVDIDIRFAGGEPQHFQGLIADPFLSPVSHTWTGIAAGVAFRAFNNGLTSGFQGALVAGVQAAQDFENIDRSFNNHVSYFAIPQNSSPTVDSEYQRCRNQVFGQGATTYAGKDIPGQHQTGLMFLAGRANPNDSAMIAALWANESNFEETPAKDAGPAQLTSWWRNNHPELIQDNAYGSWHGRTTKHFDGNVQDNIETLGNIVRFSVQRYSNYPAVAYWYGPGDPNNAKNAAKNRTNYSNEAMSRYAKYQEFFNCLPH